MQKWCYWICPAQLRSAGTIQIHVFKHTVFLIMKDSDWKRAENVSMQIYTQGDWQNILSGGCHVNFGLQSFMCVESRNVSSWALVHRNIIYIVNHLSPNVSKASWLIKVMIQLHLSYINVPQTILVPHYSEKKKKTVTPNIFQTLVLWCKMI